MTYELMNKDRKIAILEVTDKRAYISEIIESLPGYIGDIQSWVDSRTSPIGRSNIITLLKLAELDTKQDYLKVTHGISLIDTFWVREFGSQIKWEQVNPYKNKFSRIISELAINGNYYGGNLKSPSPEYSLDGSADKCWKREGGVIYLYKTSGEKWSGITGNRPYCEYYAAQVVDALIDNKAHFTPYKIKVSKTKEGYNKPYVYSAAFTTEREGYLPICDSQYRHTDLRVLESKLSNPDRLVLREMLILDSIILNYDRHGGNFGFIVDNDTYRIKRLAPIFDQDCSLGGFVSLQSVDSMKEAYKIALTKKARTDLGGYIAQARMSLTPKLVANMKNMYPFKFKRLPKEIDLDDERVEFMEYIVNSQIRAILSNE